MSNPIVKFINDEDFLAELHSDIADYAVEVVKTVRIQQYDDPDGFTRVIATYVRNGEMVKLDLLIAATGIEQTQKDATAKIEFLQDIIKEEEIEIRKGEYSFPEE
jgi:hypothetical protein